MKEFDSNPGTAKLAEVLSARMNEHGRRNNKQTLFYGTVDGSYSLSVDGFTQKIPAKDYSVIRELTELGIPPSGVTKTRYLKPGDKVLVARVADDFCIIGVLRPGDELQKGELL